MKPMHQVRTAADDLPGCRPRRRCRRHPPVASRCRQRAPIGVGALVDGSAAFDPVIDGCSVDPLARSRRIPIRAARSDTALGTGAHPSQCRDQAVVLGAAVGMVEQRQQEVGHTARGRQLLGRHGVEHLLGIPVVEQMGRATHNSGVSSPASIPMA